MADYERNNGFWETFAQSASGALGDYEQLKQQKRQRAIQKLKFIMENSDVGSQVDPQAAEEIQDYAPEGNPYIQNNQFTGTPDQQRVHGFREWAGQNPEADEDAFMTKGMTAGAISPTAYSGYQGRKVAAEQRAADQQARLLQAKEMQAERLQQQRSMQEDRQSNQANMAHLVASLRAGNGDTSNEQIENKAARQKWATARKQYGGDPYSYITQRLLNDPSTAAQELGSFEGSEFDATDPNIVNDPNAWEQYSNYHMKPDVRSGSINQYGLKPIEYEALLSHLKGITNKKKAKNAGNTSR